MASGVSAGEFVLLSRQGVTNAPDHVELAIDAHRETSLYLSPDDARAIADALTRLADAIDGGATRAAPPEG